MFNIFEFEKLPAQERQALEQSARLIEEWKTSPIVPKPIDSSAESILPPLTITTEDADKAKAYAHIAESIDDACNGGFLGWGTNFGKIRDLLQDLTADEIKQVDEVFKKKYGVHYAKNGKEWGLLEEFQDELSGADLERAKALLLGQDGNKGGDAARIDAALVERDQTFFGRTDATCEEEIRSKLLTMNSREIAQLEEDYKTVKPGHDLRSDLLDDINLSPATKEAIEIYLKGIDGRHNDKDARALAEIGLKYGDEKIFEEAFRDASPEVRNEYKSAENRERIISTFGDLTEDGVRVESTASRIARDFVEYGAISTVTELHQNQSWLGDNERAIEQSLLNMTDSQRNLYLKGRDLSANRTNAESDDDKAALKYFNQLNEELKDAGNSTEVLQWQDLIINRQSTLVGVLAGHRGVFNDDEAAAYKSIEDMSKEDWIRLKLQPGFRKSIDDMLSTYLNESEMKRADALLDQKLAANLDLAHIEESYKASQKTGLRTFEEALSDTGGTDRNAIYDAISSMTDAEQERYRNDQKFRTSIDRQLEIDLVGGAQLEVATGMLAHVKDGQKPEKGLIEKINMSRLSGPDLAQVVHDVEDALKADATLKQRLLHPQTTEDKEFAQAFDRAVRRHTEFRPGEYETYIKGLLDSEEGRLPLELKVRLHVGDFDDNERGIYREVLSATDAERARLQTDTQYANEVFCNLSSAERQIAQNLAIQGKMNPEDELRACMIGAGTDEVGIKEQLRKLNPNQRSEAIAAYSRKYGSNLIADLNDELGGQDKLEVRRLIETPSNAREQFNRDQDRYFHSRDGFGSRFVDAFWDGTGYSLDQTMNEYSKQIAECARKFQELPEAERKRLADNLNAAADLFIQSKGAAGDALTDAVLAIGAVAGAGVTGGTSLLLLGFAASAGAAVKVTTKALLMGNDYDWSSTQPWMDASNGAVNGVLGVVGASQVKEALDLGKYASVAIAGFGGGFGGATTREAWNWDSRLSVSENLEHLIKAGTISGLIGSGAGITFTALGDAAGAAIKAIRSASSDSLDNVAAQLDDTAANQSDSLATPASSNRLSSEAADAAADNSDNVANQAADAAADNSDSIKVPVADETPIKLKREEVVDLYRQLAGEDGSGVVSFTKDPTLRYNLEQVDSAAHPNGLIISTKESTTQFVTSGPIVLSDGTVIPAGSKLPYGVQISPNSIEQVDKNLNTIVGGKLIVPGEGLRLADGTILHSADLPDNVEIQVFKGQIARAATADRPADWIVLRETTDRSGNPRFDAYTNSDSTRIKKWVPVADEPGVYNPLVKPTDSPREMVQLPEEMRVQFDTDYGDATASEASFLARQPDGKGYYLVSYDDVSETMLPVDARGGAVIDALKSARQVSSTLDEVAGQTTNQVADDAGSIIRNNGRIVEVSNPAGKTTFGYDSQGQLNEVTLPGEDGMVWKRQAQGWVGYSKQGELVEGRMTDITFNVSPDGDLTTGNLGYIKQMVRRPDGMTEYYLKNGGYRIVDADRRVTEMGFESGVSVKPIYEPNSNVVSRLDLSDNSTIAVRDGQLVISRPGQDPVVYPGRGEIVFNAKSSNSDVAFGIKFGNREIELGASDDVSARLNDLQREWSQVKVNTDGSFQTALDNHTTTFRDSTERVLKVERDGQVAATFKYADGQSDQLVEVDFGGANGFKAERITGKENVWRITEAGKQYEFEGSIQLVTDPMSDVGMSVRRLSTTNNAGGELAEFTSLDGKAMTELPDGSRISKNAEGQITSTINGNRSTKYVYAADGSGLESVDIGNGRFRATRISENQWKIEGDRVDPYTFNGKLEVNQSGSLSRVSDAGLRESLRPDGSRSISYDSGTIVNIDANGRIVAVDSPAAEQGTRFEYTGKSLTRINSPNLKARRISSDEWSVSTKDGTETFKGTISVRESGEIWRNFANGDFEKIAANGDSIRFDSNGHIVAMESIANSRSGQFHYDGDEMQMIVLSDRLTAQRVGPNQWHITDAKTLAETDFTGRMGINPDGSIWRQSPSGAMETISTI